MKFTNQGYLASTPLQVPETPFQGRFLVGKTLTCQHLDRLRITRGPVRSDVLRVVRLMDEELLSRHQREQRAKRR